MSRYPELKRVGLAIRAWAVQNGLPAWAPGVVVAFVHWWILPSVLTYWVLVSEDPMLIATALALCVLTGTVQTVYDNRCPLIFVERHMLDCPTWWRGMPFNVVASYIQPAVVLGGSVIALVRFIINLLLAPEAAGEE